MAEQITVGPWSVTARENKSGNLSVDVTLAGQPHAELILQKGGKVDLLTKARRQMDLPGAWEARGPKKVQVQAGG